MTRLATVLRGAVLAALAMPATAGCGSDTTCSVDRPDPLPTPSACQSISYDVVVHDVGACGGATNCDTICGQPVFTCTDQGQGVFGCSVGATCGKARTSLRWRRRREATPLAEHLAASVWLEAASIDAFYTLADELGAHAAPPALRRAARVSAADEERHTRAMIALADRHGVQAGRPRSRPRKVRTLVAIAIENAVEGCVHETFGAALASFQAQSAADPGVRQTMRAIARDEARHATLAVAVARWAEPRLSERQRARVRAARARAVRELMASLHVEPARELVDALGIPSAARAVAIARALETHLWSRAHPWS